MAKITRRMRRIAAMLKSGKTREYIAEDLMISVSEVDSATKALEKSGEL